MNIRIIILAMILSGCSTAPTVMVDENGKTVESCTHFQTEAMQVLTPEEVAGKDLECIEE